MAQRQTYGRQRPLVVEKEQAVVEGVELRVCPKAVDMTRIMPAAREAAIDQGRPIPPELQKVFEATDRYGNPLGENPRRRADWARGGGGMWLDGFTRDHVRMRLSDRRVLEVAETGAGTLAICCPYEVSRFEDAVKATGQEGRLDVRDIAELIDAAMRPS